jgi:hypothetical protein
LAEIPGSPKTRWLGQLYKLAERLANDREDYKAADSLLKLAKVQGWTSGEGAAQPVFVNLTQADIDRLRAEVRANQEQQENAFRTIEPITLIN